MSYRSHIQHSLCVQNFAGNWLCKWCKSINQSNKCVLYWIRQTRKCGNFL